MEPSETFIVTNVTRKEEETEDQEEILVEDTNLSQNSKTTGFSTGRFCFV